MLRTRRSLWTFALSLVCAGAAADVWADAASFDPSLPPRRPRTLLRWIRKSGWQDTWTPEPRVHDSQGPHGGRVRTWYSPSLVEDLADGRTPFRRGAAMVKALYGDGSKPEGWAVMRKVKDGRSARTWWFFETTSGSPGDAVSGRGIGNCAGCHSAGRDYLLSRFRP